MQTEREITKHIIHAIQRRKDDPHLPEAYRLFNGFYEGCPGLVMDGYGPTMAIFEHDEPGSKNEIIEEITRWALKDFEHLESALLKSRQRPDTRLKNGILVAGQALPPSVSENGIRYALDLQMHQDASFYPDTRNLRAWLKREMAEKSVLNTFAYTGSLGVAAGSGGAREVVQTDLNSKFLNLAQKSWALNSLKAENHQVIVGDFFRVVGRMRNQNRLFDCVIVDPPFFSTTDAGTVDLENRMTPLLNKVRPLVAHEGWLVVINNALFLPGEDFMAELMALCQSAYLSFEATIPVPDDITGYPDTIKSAPPVDPAPFNHPTKIAILRVMRKDERKV